VEQIAIDIYRLGPEAATRQLAENRKALVAGHGLK